MHGPAFIFQCGLCQFLMCVKFDLFNLCILMVLQDTAELSAAEMVEHLKQGFGSLGQVFWDIYDLFFIFSGKWATCDLFLRHSSPLRRICMPETNVSIWVVGFYIQSVWHSIKISNNALQMVHCEVINQQEAEYGQLLIPLSDPTVAALQRLHISKFYTHQVRSFQMFPNWNF